MDAQAIEADIQADQTWRRPTWGRTGQHTATLHTILLDDIYDILGDYSIDNAKKTTNPTATSLPFSPNSHEYKALHILNITWPITHDDLKKHYKKLAKKYHPDMQSLADEEMKEQATMQFKKIHAAYQALSHYFSQAQSL